MRRGVIFSSALSVPPLPPAPVLPPPFFDPGPAYNPVGARPIIPSANTTGTIVSGAPVFDTTGCSTVECDIFSFDRHIRTPYMANYNLNIERQISSKTVLQLGYVGSQGHRLFRFRK